MSKKYTFYLEITTTCNFSCPFCPSSIKQNHFNMKLNDIYRIIEDIKDYSELIYFHVLGEPLLHPEFINILSYVDSRNIPFGITTNGVYLNEYDKQLFKFHNLKKINVSLQSLIQLNKNHIDQYIDNLISVINYRKEIDCNIPINLRLWNNKEQLDTIELNDYLFNKLNDIVSNNKNIRFSYADEFEWPSLDKLDNEISSNCLGGKKQFAILHNGNLCLCCLDYNGETSLGNLYEMSFKDIINSDKYKEIMKLSNDRKPYFELCKKCTYRNRFK